MKKIIIISLVPIILIFSAFPVYAGDTANPGTENKIAPRFTAILSMSAGLSIDSWGKLLVRDLLRLKAIRIPQY
ncbi:MAG: hypothetical protein ACOX1X_02680 [Dethiobacteria bacterium]